MTNRFQMNEDDFRALAGQEPREEISLACNADARDHIHAGSIGEPGSGLAARGIVQVHEGGSATRVFLSAPELRTLASALLNVADEIDGETPLSFFPPGSPDAKEPGA